jgi:hypothetical protein
MLRFPPPNNFPSNNDKVDDEGLITPQKITYEDLQAAVTLAHDNFVSSKWDQGNVTAYLNLHGINADACTEIFDHASNVATLLNIDPEKDPLSFKVFTEYRKNNPHLFEKWPIPSFWKRGIPLSDHIDAIMHLLFLGIVKTIMLDTQDWLKKKYKYTNFSKNVQNVMDGIIDLGLSWCKAAPYGTGKFGGHVSENYLACARVSKWLYNYLNMAAPDGVFEEPTLPQSKWLRDSNHKWLKARGLPLDGSALTLRVRVNGMMNSDDCPVPLQLGGSVDTVLNLYLTMIAMISRIMSNYTTPDMITSIDRHIRLFLDAYAVFDENVRTNSNPSWISHYNFQSLLNLPDQIQRFGPARLLWEGDLSGEAIIGYIKPKLCMGFRKFWQMSTMSKV